jgi:predicted  nucleic acid-binding Zn-ribbon protein
LNADRDALTGELGQLNAERDALTGELGQLNAERGELTAAEGVVAEELRKVIEELADAMDELAGVEDTMITETDKALLAFRRGDAELTMRVERLMDRCASFMDVESRIASRSMSHLSESPFYRRPRPSRGGLSGAH